MVLSVLLALMSGPPLWTGPVHVSDPGCLGAIHLYVDADGAPLRAEAIEDGCPRPETMAGPMPPPADAAPDLPLSAWVWETARWRDDPDALLDRAERLGATRLFVATEIADGAVQTPGALARFITLATEAGVEVWAVEGDPRMVEPAGLAHALGRAEALAAYNADRPDAPLAGLQYDIEPYLLEDYARDPAGVFAAWGEAHLALSQVWGAPVDAVIPFWMPEAPGGLAALEAARPALSRLTVMAYRTEPPVIAAISRASLAWGAGHGLDVAVALENGPLPDEHIRVYRPAPSGELALRRAATGREASLRAAASGPEAGDEAVLAFSHAVTAPADRVSFLGDLERLESAGEEAARLMAGHDSLAGLAVHEAFWRPEGDD